MIWPWRFGSLSFPHIRYKNQYQYLAVLLQKHIFLITSNCNNQSYCSMDLFSGFAFAIFIAILIHSIKRIKKKGILNDASFLKRIFKTNHEQQNFKWSISKLENTTFKNGYGIQNLIDQNPQQFSLLSILPQPQFDTIKILSKWKLRNVNRLFLNGNNIQSIQALSLLQMPFLQCLALSNNHIVTIKSLRKILASNQLYNDKDNNPLIEDLSALNDFDMPYLQFLWIQFFQNDLKSNDNIRWLAKCSSNNLQRFHIKSDWRIIEYKVLMVLKRKHLKIDVRVRY